MICVLCIAGEWFQLNKINTIAPEGKYDGFGVRGFYCGFSIIYVLGKIIF